MTGLDKVETYLIELEISYEEIAPSTYLIDDQVRGLPGVVVYVEEPIVIARTTVMPVPKKDNKEFFETLLKLNSSDIVHGAYGIDGDDIVIVDTFEYETMDKSEFEATLDAIGMALSRHYSILGKYRDK